MVQEVPPPSTGPSSTSFPLPCTRSLSWEVSCIWTTGPSSRLHPPLLALNLRWYAQFVVQRDASKTHKVMEMQIGVHGFYNSAWYAPAWNPVLGVFHNQNEQRYENGPILDAFINVQWKRACIFIKMENIGMGWPMDKADYFTAHHFIAPQRGIKLGLFWPFYTQPRRNSAVSAGGSLGGGSGEGEEVGRGAPGGLGGFGGRLSTGQNTF